MLSPLCVVLLAALPLWFDAGWLRWLSLSAVALISGATVWWLIAQKPAAQTDTSESDQPNYSAAELAALLQDVLAAWQHQIGLVKDQTEGAVIQLTTSFGSVLQQFDLAGIGRAGVGANAADIVAANLLAARCLVRRLQFRAALVTPSEAFIPRSPSDLARTIDMSSVLVAKHVLGSAGTTRVVTLDIPSNSHALWLMLRDDDARVQMTQDYPFDLNEIAVTGGALELSELSVTHGSRQYPEHGYTGMQLISTEAGADDAGAYLDYLESISALSNPHGATTTREAWFGVGPTELTAANVQSKVRNAAVGSEMVFGWPLVKPLGQPELASRFKVKMRLTTNKANLTLYLVAATSARLHLSYTAQMNFASAKYEEG